MPESEKPSVKKSSVGRRDFIKLAATGAASLIASAQPVKAEEVASPVDASAPSGAEVMTTDRPRSDFMVDVLKSLNFEYLASNPASTFRGLQESIVNYGGNKNPEWLTCLHEESSVGIAHGYFLIEGKPMAIMCHPTGGLQHASMQINHAFDEHVPVYVIIGTAPFDVIDRRPGPDWSKAAVDPAAIARDYTKWDDTPMSLGHFAESAVRAYRVAMTPPYGPTIIVVDSALQERPMDEPKPLIPKLTLPSPPTGEPGAVEEAARMLVNADYPVIRAGGHIGRNENSLKLLVELAEILQAPVKGGNFPSRHPLNGGNIGNADVILALELDDFYAATHAFREQLTRTTRSTTKPGVKRISITTRDLYIKANYQSFNRFQEVDLGLAADGEATLPLLIEAVKRLITPDRRRLFQDRGAKLAEAHRAERERTRQEAAYAWDLSPISHARLAYELWEQVKKKDWSLVIGGDEGAWTQRVWDIKKPYQFTGVNSSGVACKAAEAIGAALANKKYGRLSINIQKDGDLMYSNGVIWTAAHHRIPLLTCMHNNRAYHQEVMHLQRCASQRSRNPTTANVGTSIDDPNIDYAMLAKSMGWYGEGPITDPKELGPAIKRAIAVVERGEPAMLDTVMQPR
jgi:acetolactate synthase I/II/III large subunit